MNLEHNGSCDQKMLLTVILCKDSRQYSSKCHLGWNLFVLYFLKLRFSSFQSKFPEFGSRGILNTVLYPKFVIKWYVLQ